MDASFREDGLTRRGATRLAHTIQKYWADRGYDVALTVARARVPRYEPGRRGGSTTPALTEVYVVRSDLGPNGHPQRRRPSAIKYEAFVTVLP